MQWKNRLLIIILFIFGSIVIPNAGLSSVVFPVDGLLGDSFYPRDISEKYTAKGERKQYTVVRGGKYWGSWGNRGKGTGGHPAVDITVGLKVYATMNGEVAFAKDWGDFGGTVVIKHDKSLFNTPTHLWSGSSHLKKWYVEVGDIVEAGDVIGLMGGGIGDPYRGESTGKHIHFFIDTGDVFLYPYWPATGTETPDLNIDNNTIDPIAFLESHMTYFVGKHSQGWFFEDGLGPRPPSGPRNYLPNDLEGYWAEPFADCYRNNGGLEYLGVPINHVHLSSMGGTGGAEKVYMQTLSYGDGALIYSLVLNNYVANTNYENKLGVCYVIYGMFRDYWINNFSALGAPVTNRYSIIENDIIKHIQWFEPSDNNYVCVVYNTETDSFSHGSSEQMGIPLDQEVFDQDKELNSNDGMGGGGFLDTPQNLSATPLSTSSINLTYDIPQDIQNGNYDVKIWMNGSLEKREAVDGSVDVTGLSSNMEYCFTASFINNDNGVESEKSNIDCAVTLDENNTPPGGTPDPIGNGFWANSGLTCQDVEFTNDPIFPYQPVGATSNFYINNNSQVAYYFTFMSVIDAHNITYKWYDSNGQLIRTGSDTVGVNGQTQTDNTEWDYCSISNTERFGAWWIHVYVDSQLVDAIEFNVLVNLLQPANLSANVVDFHAELTWDGVPYAKGYKIFRDSVLIDFVTSSSYTDNSVEDNNVYTYSVKAVRDSESSIMSNEVTADIPEKIIGAVDSIIIPDQNANGHPEIVTLGLHPTTKEPLVKVIDKSTLQILYELNYFHINCKPIQVVYFSDGNGNGYGELAVLVEDLLDQGKSKIEIRDILTGDIFVPSPNYIPNGITAVETTSTLVSLNWNHSGADSYNIYRSTISQSYGDVYATTNSNSFIDESVEADTTYFYIVTSVVDGVESEFSEEFSITTPGAGEITPSCGLYPYVDFKLLELDSILYYVSLGSCPSTDNPYVLVSNKETGAVTHEIPFFTTDYSPLELIIFNDSDLNGFPEFGVMAMDEIEGDVEIEIRDMETGILQ